MRKHDDVSRITTAWRTSRALGRRRPTILRAGVLLSLITLVGACTDLTRTASPPADIQPPVLNVSLGDGPKVATDKQDYSPGETVEIIGWEWTAGETVTLKVTDTSFEGEDSRPSYQPWDVIADTEGSIAASWLVPADADGLTLKLTADGQTSAAHAELLFTDLTGTLALYSDDLHTISQTAYPWGATVYPQLTGVTGDAATKNCYQIEWKNPSNAVVQTNTFGPGATSYNPPSFTLPATNASGTWSVVVAQNTASNCGGPFTSATNPILFDVARAVVIGAGTIADDAAGGDQCVSQLGAPPPGCGAIVDRLSVRSQSGNNVHTFLRFDLATASPGVLSAGVVVTDAKVRLTLIGTPGQDRLYDIQRTTNAWDEGNLGTFPGPVTTGTVSTTTILASATTPGGGGGDPQTWYKWNVTAHVQGFVDGSFTNHGWRISDQAQNNGTPRLTQFRATEHACTPGTSCKRTWPVLLIDYVDPPKLLFYTPVRSGIVGQCLGPIQVRSFEFNGTTPLPVTGDLTVNLSTANLGTGDIFGTAGAGSFFSNGTCTTPTTTTTILNEASISQAFYYRATHRGDGGHDVVASATGYTPDPSQTETINKAPTTVVYTGDLVLLAGSTFTLKAQLISPYAACQYNGTSTPYGRRVLFRIEDDPTDGVGYLGFPFTFTDASGLATRTTPTTGWLEDIYDITANAVDNDDCDAGKDNAALAVLLPGNAATGGGFLAGNKVGGGRVNFGFNVRPIENSDPIAYKGQFLLIKQDGGVPLFRCKGYLDTYGEVPGTTPQKYAASGKCDFQLWDPDLNDGWGDWYVPEGAGYANQEFTIYFIDNGQGRGRDAPDPDQFGFSVGFVGPAIGDPTFPIAEINGGNIDAKGESPTPTGTKGGGKKG